MALLFIPLEATKAGHNKSWKTEILLDDFYKMPNDDINVRNGVVSITTKQMNESKQFINYSQHFYTSEKGYGVGLLICKRDAIQLFKNLKNLRPY